MMPPKMIRRLINSLLICQGESIYGTAEAVPSFKGGFSFGLFDVALEQLFVQNPLLLGLKSA